MSENAFVTPLGIDHLYVVDFEFKMHSSPTEHMLAELSVNLNDDERPVFVEESSYYSLSKTVEVSYGLTDAEDPEVKPLRVSIAVHVEATLPVKDRSEQAEEFMLSSSVSIAYSHARSCIMNLAAMSPVGELVIPTVNPRALVKTVGREDNE